jgi:hypothetical protein
MDHRKTNFLAAVLGVDVAGALVKAAERSEVLVNALVPRTILAWLDTEAEYSGNVPGVDGTYVSFTKSQAGYSGSVTIGEDLHQFDDESDVHVAASVAVAIGLHDELPSPDMRDVDIQKLGKSIELAVKTQRLRRLQALQKAFCPGCISKKSEHRSDCEKADKDPEKQKFEKDELEKGKQGPGLPAAPTAPAAPSAPVAAGTTPPKPKSLKPPKTAAVAKPPTAAKPVTASTVKLTRSETTHRCAACGITQFRGDRILGCMCLRDLCKSARVVAADENFVTVALGIDWDKDALVTLLEAVGRK